MTILKKEDETMPIPKEILAVPRPKNTVVIVYGKDKNLFAVRQRVGCKNVNGRHIPINGPTIGHIVNGEYVPVQTEEPVNISAAPIDLKDWADVMLCDNVFRNIQHELYAVYSKQDALKLYCIAVLRVCCPGLKDSEVEEAYETSFLSELYPDVALSGNTVSTFLTNLGKAVSRILQFMQNRVTAAALDHHLLIDSMLKSDESTVNSLSDVSHKERTKGTRDISVVYAFDLEAMEPVCSLWFPGNMPDVASYTEFLADTKIMKGLIVADKGFPKSVAYEHVAKHADLHYMNLLERGSKLADRYRMLDVTRILPGYEGIACKKEKCAETDNWLYSFRDSRKAGLEEQDWLRRAKKAGTYSLSELRQKQAGFGTVVLECDLDLPEEIVYKAYSKRWEIEIVMRYYKDACQFEETRVQDDYSVIGSEFCDFLSTLLTFRLLKAFDRAKLLETMTYKKIMTILKQAKKIRIDGEHWQIIHINPSQEIMLQALDLLPKPEPAAKKKRGRPKKQKV